MATKQVKQSTSVKSPVSAVVMTIDMGGSKTKIVVQEVGSSTPRVLLMESQLADIGRNPSAQVPSTGLGSERAWVGFDKATNAGDEVNRVYYAVGALARHRFGGLPQLEELKYELALPKILAAIWFARVELSLSPKLNLFLSVLLPGGEMSDKDILKSRLLAVTPSFETPSGKMAVKLSQCDVSSEGSGIYNYRRLVLGDKIYSKHQLFVMLGFRNASAFVVRGGANEPGVTSNFGMYWMLDALASQISGFDKNDPGTIQIVVDSAADPNLLKRLSRKRDKQDIDDDFVSITNAVSEARSDYVRAIARWLKGIAGSFDEIIFCGGTSEYLRPDLEKYYATDTTKIIWHGGVTLPDEVKSTLGCFRLADVWALHGVFFELISTGLTTNRKANISKSVAIERLVTRVDEVVSATNDDTSLLTVQQEEPLVTSARVDATSDDNEDEVSDSIIPSIKSIFKNAARSQDTPRQYAYETTERPAKTVAPIEPGSL